MDIKIKTLPFKCVLCNVTLHSQKCIRAHELGRRHRVNTVVQRCKNNNSDDHRAEVKIEPVIAIDLQGANAAYKENRCSSATGESISTTTNMQANASLYNQQVRQGDATIERNECNNSLEGDLGKNDAIKEKKECNTNCIDDDCCKTVPLEHVFQGIDMIKNENECDDSNTNHLSEDGLKCNLCSIFLLSTKTKMAHLQGNMHKVALTLEREKLRKPIISGRKKIVCTLGETKKQRTLKRHLLCKQYRNIKCHLRNSILIKDFPRSLTHKEVLEYFSTREKVVNSFFRADNQYAVIEFPCSKSLNEVLSKDAILEGRKLKIKPATYSDKEIRDMILNFKKINETIRDLPDFQTQLHGLIKEVQPNCLSNKYEVLCADLQTILQETFPGCLVFPFGAADTGLGFTTSVVDIHVEMFKAAGTSKDSQCQNETYYIDKTQELLQKRNLIFLELPIDNKVGIVECVHSPTKLKCDLYFTKWMSVRSTSLIRYYLSLDNKLKPLMILIKYWGTVHQLIRTPCTSFSTYSLTLLLVFYLQQSPYLLPSVVSMQPSQDPIKSKESWNTEFVPLEDFVSEPLFNQSIPKILHGFFDYYTNFDYLLKVICPYLGKPIPKTEFFNPEFLADKFPRNTSEGFNTASAIYLQDPYKHRENVTSSVSTQFLKKFIELCRVGADIFANRPVDHLALHKLFIPPLRKYHISGTTIYQFPIRMQSHLRYISSIINNNVLLNPEERLMQTRKAWYNLVNNFIFAIFTDLMKFTIYAEDNRRNIKSQRLNEQADVYDTGITDLITFRCSRVGTYNIQNAKEDGTILKGINLDYQRKLINFMCLHKFILNNHKLDVKMQARINPTEIVVFLTGIKRKDFYLKTFAKFLAKYVPVWFKEYITELDKSLLFKNVQSDKLECIQPKPEELESDEPKKEEFGKPTQIKSKLQGNDNGDLKFQTFVEVKLETELANNETEYQTFEKPVQIKYEPEEFENNIAGAVAHIKSEFVEAEVQKTEYNMESTSEIENFQRTED